MNLGRFLFTLFTPLPNSSTYYYYYLYASPNRKRQQPLKYRYVNTSNGRRQHRIELDNPIFAQFPISFRKQESIGRDPFSVTANSRQSTRNWDAISYCTANLREMRTRGRNVFTPGPFGWCQEPYLEHSRTTTISCVLKLRCHSYERAQPSNSEASYVAGNRELVSGHSLGIKTLKLPACLNLDVLPPGCRAVPWDRSLCRL